MEKLKKHYDRVLLIVIGLITLVACSMLIMKSFAIGENFQGVDPGDGKKTTPAPIEQVTQASGLFETKPEWKQPKAADSDKVYRLFASIPIGTRLRNRVSGRGFDLAIVGMLAVSAAALCLQTFL